MAGGTSECSFQLHFCPVAVLADAVRSIHPKGIVYLHIEFGHILEAECDQALRYHPSLHWSNPIGRTAPADNPDEWHN
ncbi:hypothetical protein D3C76_1695380 [compost metagenome]